MPATFANYHRPSKDTAERFADAPSVTLDTVDAEDVADELLEVSAPAAAKTTTSRTRTARGNWLDALRRSDVKALWTELHRLVCYHPLVRASWSAGLLVETDAHSNRANANVDLTQELFVTLLSKQRFQHYLDTEMTDAEIECEIGQIELTNLLTAELRKRHPESYRLARRISTIIQTSPNFRRFDVSNEKFLAGEEEPHRRLADRVYGLSEWQHGKPRRGAHDMDRRAHLIPMRARDTRLVGCTGDAQIIISNADLENLIVSILEAIDAPADVRALRGLVMARLPVMDIYLVPLGGDDDDDDNKKRVFEPVDLGETPEQGLLRREREDAAANRVEGFLKSLHQTVRGKAKQYERMLGVLWFCYLNPDQITQLEAAARLGVSDSLISDYRRRIEAELRALAFGELEEARRFERALREHVETLVTGGVTGDMTKDVGIAV
ncbi:MAG: hypothetical protein MSG64_05175 [Pyrinomonadaceae bacterium MAG19_C2-C3]|nr:hypothetical protein [Pyrinomonadaceae bacterium MAG19_C2-C3]